MLDVHSMRCNKEFRRTLQLQTIVTVRRWSDEDAWAMHPEWTGIGHVLRQLGIK
jgi:hypothetical protein